jgi:hypothetical protein
VHLCQSANAAIDITFASGISPAASTDNPNIQEVQNTNPSAVNTFDITIS